MGHVFDQMSHFEYILSKTAILQLRRYLDEGFL